MKYYGKFEGAQPLHKTPSPLSKSGEGDTGDEVDII
jgi:hypothetical protein